jgi:hypothetical protein
MREMKQAMAQLRSGSSPDGTTTYGNIDLPYEVPGDELAEKASDALEEFATDESYTTDVQERRQRYRPDKDIEIPESSRLEARSTRGVRRKLFSGSREGFFLDIDHERTYEEVGIDTIGGTVPESDIDTFVDRLYEQF